MMKGYAGAVAVILAVVLAALCVAFCYFKGRRGETKAVLVLLLKVLIVAVVWCMDK